MTNDCVGLGLVGLTLCAFVRVFDFYLQTFRTYQDCGEWSCVCTSEITFRFNASSRFIFPPSFVWLPILYPFIDFLRVSLGSDRCEHENCFSFPSHSHFLVAFCCRAIDKITIMAGDGAKAQPKYIRDTILACDDWSTKRCVDVCSMFLCTTKWRGVVHKLYYRKIDLEIRMTTRTNGKCCHGNVSVDCGTLKVEKNSEAHTKRRNQRDIGHAIQ